MFMYNTISLQYTIIQQTVNLWNCSPDETETKFALQKCMYSTIGHI